MSEPPFTLFGLDISLVAVTWLLSLLTLFPDSCHSFHTWFLSFLKKIMLPLLWLMLTLYLCWLLTLSDSWFLLTPVDFCSIFLSLDWILLPFDSCCLLTVADFWFLSTLVDSLILSALILADSCLLLLTFYSC